MFSEKYHYFIYVSSGMYSMTICDKSQVLKLFITIKIKILLLHGVDKM